MSMTVQDQINFLKEQQATYQAESPVDTNKVNAIINQISELEYQLKQQEQEHEERVTTAVSQFDQLIEKLDFGGMSLREVIGE